MKRKIIFTAIGLITFLICFTASLLIHDYLYEQRLRSDIYKVKVGMTEQEVIEILGEPSHKLMSDIPGLYWAYDTSSIGQLLDDNPDRIGHILLEMGAGKRVVKVIYFKD